MTLLLPYQTPVGATGKLFARGRTTRDVGGGTPVDPDPPTDGYPARYQDLVNESWKLNSGQHHADEIPAGMLQVNAWDYSTSSDVDVIVKAVEQAVNQPVAIWFKPLPYYVNKFQVMSDGSYRGITNGTRADGKKYAQILIGPDRTYDGLGNVVSETQFRMNPDAAKNSPNYVRDGVTYTFPEAGFQFAKYGTAIYMSGSGQTAPTKILGITLDGAFMGPYGTFSASIQNQLQRNKTAAGPVPWMGCSFWSLQAGSVMRWVRFRGWSMGHLAAPPLEVGNGSSNRSRIQVWDSESDGRLPAYVDSARPVSGGGWMANKEDSLYFKNFWMRYSRTSGNAYNTNFNQDGVLLKYENFQQEHIADTLDGFPMYVAGDGLSGFSGFQFEEFTGSVEITNCYVDTVRSHINWPLPGIRSDTGEAQYLPSGRPFLIARGLRTGTTQYYGGCIRVGTSKTPGGAGGTSPIWQYLTNNGASAAKNYFQIYKEDGVTLKDFVFAKNYQSAIHKPQDYCVLTSF